MDAVIDTEEMISTLNDVEALKNSEPVGAGGESDDKPENENESSQTTNNDKNNDGIFAEAAEKALLDVADVPTADKPSAASASAASAALEKAYEKKHNLDDSRKTPFVAPDGEPIRDPVSANNFFEFRFFFFFSFFFSVRVENFFLKKKKKY